MFIFSLLKTIIIVIIILVIILFTSIITEFKLPKDEIMNAYDNFIGWFGTHGISADTKLKGKRTLGIDEYVGTYDVNYSNYTGEEVIFGGTVLHRKNGEKLKIDINLEKQSGEVDVVNKLGTNEISLINDTGKYNGVVYIDGVSYYMIVRLNNFTGRMNIKVE